MATVPVTKPYRDQPGRVAYVSAPMGAGDDSTPIKGLSKNESVVVSLAGTLTSAMIQTRNSDTEAWVPCLTAVVAAPGAVSLFNVMDQLRVVVTTGSGVVASVLMRGE